MLGACVLATVVLAVVPVPPALAATPITVSGTVTDQFGDPVAGVHIEAINHHWRGAWETFGETTTDAGGHYSFAFDPRHRLDGGLVLWAVSLRVVGPDHWRESAALPDYEPGDSMVVDVEIEQRPHVTGLVTDGAGTPVAGASVRFHNVATEGNEECSDEYGCPLGWWNEREVTTDGEGRFSTWSHSRDLIGVVVSAPGFVTQVIYDVASGEHLAVQLVPGEPGPEPMTISGVLRDPAGAPVPGVTVYLSGGRPSPGSTTDGEGRYQLSISPLALDRWAVVLAVEARVDGVYGASVDVPRGPSGYYEPGAHHDIDLTFEEPGRIQGLVVDESGAPVPDVRVSAGSASVTVFTGADGRYDLEIRPGSYTLVTGGLPRWYWYYLYPTVAAGDVVEMPTQVLEARPLPAAPTDVRATALGPRRAEVIARFDAGDTTIDLRVAQCRGRDAPLRRVRVEGYEPAGYSSVRVGRLLPDHRYRCRGRSRTGVGWSPWSTWSDPFRTPRVN